MVAPSTDLLLRNYEIEFFTKTIKTLCSGVASGGPWAALIDYHQISEHPLHLVQRGGVPAGGGVCLQQRGARLWHHVQVLHAGRHVARGAQDTFGWTVSSLNVDKTVELQGSILYIENIERINSRGCYWIDTKPKYVIKIFFVILYVQASLLFYRTRAQQQQLNRGISLIIMGLASYTKWRNKTSTRRPTSARTESRAEASVKIK
ncbi:hypothetical protein SFRURICE_013418 [Spodoptera frugiperda]|nr:hypothetical protein SFRURICE_013418 [Spodoptera frugiperda]